MDFREGSKTPGGVLRGQVSLRLGKHFVPDHEFLHGGRP
jgi:hypothetical protein